MQTLIESMTQEGIFYGIIDDGHGHITCTCPDYINRRAEKGEHCKHIVKYLETHPEIVIVGGKEFVRNAKGKLVSRKQYEHLANNRKSLTGEVKKPVPVRKPAPQLAVKVVKPVTINGDAIAYIDAIQSIERLGGLSESLKRSITAGKTGSFVIDLPMLGMVLSCEKIGRGWRFKTINKA